jgi:protein TonB
MQLFSFFKQPSSGWIKLSILITLFIALLTGCAKRQEDPHSGNDEKHTAVETQATFPGGMEAFYAYLTANIHYPTAARQNNVQGKVIIVFIIDTDGSVTDVKVQQGIGNGCDEEAVRVIKASPKWIPATQDGRAVRQQFTVPINFVLTDSANGQKQNSVSVGSIF